MLDTKILIILRNKLRNNNFKNKLFKSDNDKDLQTLIAYEELAIGVDELKKLRNQLMNNMTNFILSNSDMMQGEEAYELKFFLNNLKENSLKIINSNCLDKYLAVLSNLNYIRTDEVVLESNLNDINGIVDLSLKIDKKFQKKFFEIIDEEDFKEYLMNNNIWNNIYKMEEYWKCDYGLIENIWFEIDYDTIDKIVEPCIFLDATKIYKNNDCLYVLENLIDSEVLLKLKDNLRNCINKLPEGVDLYQFGVMLSRNTKAIRIFTNEMTDVEILDYLQLIKWSGDFKKLTTLLNFLNRYSNKQYIVDFDVLSDSISSKIGIDFYLDYSIKNINVVFLKKLIEIGLCEKGKVQNIYDFLNIRDKNILYTISHYKLCIEHNSIYIKIYLKLESYMKYGGGYINE